ncbi:site-specific integrase [bacterium]|nr:site-specific integrase [bacterium]
MPRKVPFDTGLFGRFKPFHQRWTAHPRFLEKYVRKLKQKNWGWHNLRHRFASKLSKEGRPLYEIMALLGHSNLSTTQRYLQLLQ